MSEATLLRGHRHGEGEGRGECEECSKHVGHYFLLDDV
jgi:hypothetical protein